MLRYTACQLMVDTVLRLQFGCGENNTKFQQHENLSLPSSQSEPTLKLLCLKYRDQNGDKYYPGVKSIRNRNGKSY